MQLGEEAMINMNNEVQTQIQLLPRTNRLDLAYQTMDELHSAASDGELDTFDGIQNRQELLNWLRDVIYMAQETIVEIEGDIEIDEPMLRIVEKNFPKLIVLEKVE